jgi:hypothetical protein
MEKTLNENREKVSAVAARSKRRSPTRRRRWKRAGVERLNNAFNSLQSVSHKMAEALYQQTGPASGETTEQSSAAGASTARKVAAKTM